jgi:hypothetical protein
MAQLKILLAISKGKLIFKYALLVSLWDYFGINVKGVKGTTTQTT